jgi:RNA polymerase sigma-70 factor, ECF subfamily
MNEPPTEKRVTEPFEQLLERLRPEVVRFSYWLARDRSVAEDVVQETLIRAWRARTELKDGNAARAWLFTIARREHARLYERKRLPLVDLDDMVMQESAELAAETDSTTLELRTAILKLADEYREPLVMQVLGGFSTQEIAAALGLSQQAVLTRLFRARNQLRVIYGLQPAAAAAMDDGQ